MPTTIASVHAFALTLPDTTAALACAGTAIESRTAVTGGKTFLFAGAGVLRFKLAASIPELTKLAAAEPERYEVGKGGWIKVTVRDGTFPPVASLRRWIAESHGLYKVPAKRDQPAKGPQRSAGSKPPVVRKKAATKRRGT